MRNLNLYKKNTFKFCAYFLSILCSIFASDVLFAQTPAIYYKPGALFLTSAQYAQLPTTNWDTLTKYSIASKTIALKSAIVNGNIVMLNTPPVGDQGLSQESCVGWAVGYTATSILTYPKYNCWSLANRSPSYVYNQIKVSSDCLSASYTLDALKLVTSQGDCAWNMMPYVDNDCSMLPNSTQKFDASTNTVLKYYTVGLTDVASIKKAINLGYPIIIAFNIWQSFDDMWNSTGVWNTIYGKSRGGHATCIIGYDDGKQMFKVQNSWGYGGDPFNPGFFWITYTMIQNTCLTEAYVLYGMNPAYPETVSGSSYVCSSGTTYTVINLPTGYSVSWQPSQNLSTILGQNSNSYVVSTASGSSGSGWVQPTITSASGCSFALPQYPVMILDIPYVNSNVPLAYWGSSAPMVVNPSNTSQTLSSAIDYGIYNPVCNLQTYTTSMIVENATSVNWTRIAANPSALSWGNDTPNNIHFYFWQPNQTEVFTINASNGCGSVSYSFGFKSIDCSNGGGGGGGGCSTTYAVSPNPANSKVVIVPNIPAPCNTTITASAQSISSISVYNSQGVIKKKMKYIIGNTTEIDVSDLPTGMYQINIFDGTTTTTKQIVVQR